MFDEEDDRLSDSEKERVRTWMTYLQQDPWCPKLDDQGYRLLAWRLVLAERRRDSGKPWTHDELVQALTPPWSKP